jgi:hypothetical protein
MGARGGAPLLKRTQPRRPLRPAGDAIAALSRISVPEFEIDYIPEAQLIFGRQNRLADPRTGLGLYGPYDIEHPRRAHIQVGIIGTGETIGLFQRWADQCRSKVIPVRQKKEKGRWTKVPMDPTVFTPFPGTRDVFDAEFTISSAHVSTLRDADIAELEQIQHFEPRVTRLVHMLIERLQVLNDKPSPPDVVVCALPTRLRELCTVPTKHKRQPKIRTREQATRASLEHDDQKGQTNLFGVEDLASRASEAAVPTSEHTILHHGLKARAMSVGLSTQLVWQATLEAKGVEDDATRAWNFWTGVYYKAGNVPWKLAGLQTGTCYVGISFYVDKRDSSYRCCMAQAFTDTGRGFVLRSDPFKWNRDLGSPHVTDEALATDLLNRILDEYLRHMEHPPGRVVIHKKSRYWAEEREGFLKALNPRVRAYDMVAFGERGIRFFRTGAHPPLRNTMITLGRGNALLYTQGYVPFLGEFSGMRVPRPLEIVEHIGSSSLRLVAEEILALTKMDYNSTAFAGRGPITTAFSEDVGDILAELPEGIEPRTQYRFYM